MDNRRKVFVSEDKEGMSQSTVAKWSAIAQEAIGRKRAFCRCPSRGGEDPHRFLLEAGGSRREIIMEGNAHFPG
jgi:hypothetical protein